MKHKYCKGRCRNYPGSRTVMVGRRLEGEKLCRVCQFRVKTDAIYCPCCGMQLGFKKINNYSRK